MGHISLSYSKSEVSRETSTVGNRRNLPFPEETQFLTYNITTEMCSCIYGNSETTVCAVISPNE